MSMEVLSLAATVAQLKIQENMLLQPLVQPLGNTQVPRKELLLLAQLIYKAAIGAIRDLQAGKLESFDALVSDCACQIRAIYVAQLAQKMRGAPECQTLLATLEKGQQGIQALVQKMQTAAQKMGARVDNVPVQYLQEAGLDTAVSEEVTALTCAYMLTKTKHLYMDKVRKSLCHDCGEQVSHVSEKTDENKLNPLQKGVNMKILMLLVNTAKKKLAEIGARHLEKAAVVPALAYPQNKRLIHDRMELPCIFTAQAMMRLAAHNNIAILVKVRRAAHLYERLDDPYDVTLLYKPVTGHLPEALTPVAGLVGLYGEYHAGAPVKENKPVIVIEGQRCDKSIKDESVADYTARLLQESLMDIVEMGATAHKQYSQAGELSELVYETPGEAARLQGQAARAIAVGASQANQRLLSITHIFASVL